MIEPGSDENRLIAERREKLHAHRSQTATAFPNDVWPSHRAKALSDDYQDESREALESLNLRVTVAGRMMLKRVQGKASFASVQDASGRIQIYLNDEGVGAENHEAFKHWDIGDIVLADGILFKTMKGELSIRATAMRLVTKSLRPLPDKFHGLADQETRYRQRYVDLIMSEESRDVFLKRSKIVSTLRQLMNRSEFLEVETPMMHPIPGGAAAKPFVTHHKALAQDMYLRVAPELYLKRLIVGGFERVFEINRNFRNEGISPRHNPEFTMMEFYAAYTDYRWLMDFTEMLLRDTAIAVCGDAKISYQGHRVDLEKPFARMTIVEAIRHQHPEWTEAQLRDDAFIAEQLRALGEDLNRPSLRNAGLGSLQLALFEACAETKLWQPTFIVDYPVEVSPLARASDTDGSIAERFELFITGKEMANGFSELNDPEDQAARFQAQVAAKEAGDEEAMFFDADYVRALEYGMPPTGGCGIGIDRLSMLLADRANIRDVILFPALKREEHH